MVERHSCNGKMLIDRYRNTAQCYECGRTIPFNPVPVDIGAAHLQADIKGTGLRSRGRVLTNG